MDILAIDIDGVLANFVDSMLPHMNGLFSTEFKREDVTCFDFWSAFGMKKEEFNPFWDYMDERNLWVSIAPMPGAINQLRLLSEVLDFEYVTTRPAQLESPTSVWLSSNGFPDKPLNMVEGKIDINTRFRYFIDDRLEDCLYLAAIDNIETVILFDAPWNRSVNLPQNIIRVKDWDEITPRVFGL